MLLKCWSFLTVNIWNVCERVCEYQHFLQMLPCAKNNNFKWKQTGFFSFYRYIFFSNQKTFIWECRSSNWTNKFYRASFGDGIITFECVATYSITHKTSWYISPEAQYPRLSIFPGFVKFHKLYESLISSFISVSFMPKWICRDLIWTFASQS